MIKRAMMTALLGLAVASHAVRAQDMTSPAHPAYRSAQPAGSSADQKALDRYWAAHDDDAPGYPFNP